jgi:hypothetical protein
MLGEIMSCFLFLGEANSDGLLILWFVGDPSFFSHVGSDLSMLPLYSNFLKRDIGSGELGSSWSSRRD